MRIQLRAFVCLVFFACQAKTAQDAKDLYRLEQTACVVKAKTKPEAEECRMKVDQAWGRKSK